MAMYGHCDREIGGGQPSPKLLQYVSRLRVPRVEQAHTRYVLVLSAVQRWVETPKHNEVRSPDLTDGWVGQVLQKHTCKVKVVGIKGQ